MKIAELSDVCRAYHPGRNVLDGVSFSVEPGEIVGLLGENGAGKTTLMRIAMGMLEAQSGEVRLFGLDPRTQAVEIKRRVGYVSEDQILPPFLRVRQVLELHRELFPTWDDEIAGALATRFSLPLDEKIKHLSKGQARQVALLCAIGHRPELLLLDEPAGGLDPAARREFLEASIQLLNAAGTTILFSSHYMSDVERMADRVVMLHEGRVLLDNSLDELREGFAMALVAADEGLTVERLLQLDGCVAARERAGSVRTILRMEPEQARECIARELPGVDARCTSIGLEDMFIELVGGQR